MKKATRGADCEIMLCCTDDRVSSDTSFRRCESRFVSQVRFPRTRRNDQPYSRQHSTIALPAPRFSKLLLRLSKKVCDTNGPSSALLQQFSKCLVILVYPKQQQSFEAYNTGREGSTVQCQAVRGSGSTRFITPHLGLAITCLA